MRLDWGDGRVLLGHGMLIVPGEEGAVEGFRASDGQNLWSFRVGFELLDMVLAFLQEERHI